MRKIFIYLFFTQVPFLLMAQTPLDDPHWQLVWGDEFNSGPINTTDWEVKHNCDAGDPDKPLVNSWVIFTNRTENVDIVSGNLVLRLKQESYPCPVNVGINGTCGGCVRLTHDYTSGWIETKQLHDIQYGYIEAKIKIPYAIGIHPAFWTFNGHNLIAGNPYNEIDIFEMIPGQSQLGISNQNNYQMTTNVHVDSAQGFVQHGQVHTVNDYTQWHTYAIEWTPNKIIWYVDGNVIRNSENYFYNSDGIFNLNRIVLNIGLDYSVTSPINQEMLVDYVRLYQLDVDCNNLINSCFYDFSTYDHKVKNSITIGDGGCSNTVAVGSNVRIRASEFIKLSGNFSVPLGASFYADANKNCSNTFNLACTQIYNRCQYNFVGYDNAIKKQIDLGGTGCIVTINPTNDNKLLKATDKIILTNGVTIVPQNGKKAELSIVSCP